MSSRCIVFFLLFWSQYATSQIIEFGPTEDLLSTNEITVPIIATDSFQQISGYQVGIEVEGSGYEITGIDGFADHDVANQSYNNVKAGYLWFEPSGLYLDKIQGDTLALLRLTRVDTADLCMNLRSSISEIENIMVKNEQGDRIEVPFTLEEKLYCAFDSLYIEDSIVQNICFGDSIGSIHIDIYGGVMPYQVTWISEGLDTIANQVNELTLLGNGRYILSVIDSLGNRIRDTFEINSSSELGYDVVTVDSICINDSNGSISVTTDSSNMVIWNNGETGFELTQLDTGWYHFEIVNGADCSVNDSVRIVSYPSPTFEVDSASCYSCPDGAIRIFNNPGLEVENVQITDSDGNEVNANELAPGSYTLTLDYFDGCRLDTMFTIPVKPGNIGIFKIISVITPNSGDDNSALIFDGLEDFPDNNLTIFNKWGHTVFKKDGYQENMSSLFVGDIGGMPLPEGNYYYVLKVKGFDKPLKSSLTILR